MSHSVHCTVCRLCCCVFFFNDTATTEIYTLSLHDALPIWYPWPDLDRYWQRRGLCVPGCHPDSRLAWHCVRGLWLQRRSEEHTSELQSRPHLVCRLLLEKKKDLTGAPDEVAVNDAAIRPLC